MDQIIKIDNVYRLKTRISKMDKGNLCEYAFVYKGEPFSLYTTKPSAEDFERAEKVSAPEVGVLTVDLLVKPSKTSGRGMLATRYVSFESA